LDISDLRTVMLFQPSSDHTAPYATLSYCWGKNGVPLTTATGNLASHLTEGTPLSAFPETLREAIPFVGDLGFRYLWIDALEWAHQAAEMTSIYEGCALNIAIADSPSCSVGTTT